MLHWGCLEFIQLKVVSMHRCIAPTSWRLHTAGISIYIYMSAVNSNCKRRRYSTMDRIKVVEVFQYFYNNIYTCMMPIIIIVI